MRIDGAADDEVTYRRNTEAYELCDLVPNVSTQSTGGLDQSLAPHGARFAVARDAQRDDPDLQRRGIGECRLNQNQGREPCQRL